MASLLARFAISLAVLLGGPIVPAIAAADEPAASEKPPAPPKGSGPSTMPYKPGDPIPKGYHVGPLGNPTFFVAGVVALPNLYVGSIVGAVKDESARAAFIPVFGPFIVGATHPPLTSSGKGIGPVNVLYIADGAAQAVSLIMLILSIELKEDALIRTDLYPPGKEPLVRREPRGSVAVGPGSIELSVRF